jgi:hypothetical protein
MPQTKSMNSDATNGNLLTKQNIYIRSVLSYIEVICAGLLHIVETEPSVANIAWSFNIVCVDGQSERFHCAC